MPQLAIYAPEFKAGKISGRFRGARGTVAPPPPAISGHAKGWMCCYKNTLILVFCTFQCITSIATFQRVAPTTPPDTTLVSSLSQNFKI